MSDFVHLHVHSHYSLLDGMGRIDELIDAALEHGMSALALTDHGVLYGAIEFFGQAKKKGLKPIIGMEAYVAAGRYDEPKPKENLYHLILLAANEIGYRNLIALTSEAHLRGYYFRPRIDHRLLEAHHEGLIVLSACLGGELAQAILTGEPERERAVLDFYAEQFRDRYYLELQDHPKSPDQIKVNRRLRELAQARGLPLVATADVHYIRPEDKEAHDALLCVQTGKFISDDHRLRLTDYDIFLKSEAELEAAFADLPEALRNTRAIAEQVGLAIELGKPRLPRFPTPKRISADDHLKRLSFERLPERYPEVSPALKRRLDKELRVIKATGFADYFLIVADVVNWARSQQILVGPGRGSAAGSLVSYVLGITSIDPIKFELIFERFLSPDRIAPPDIDLDFADHRRDEVIEYVTKRYGEDHVAQIITFGTMAARNSVRDVGRVLGHTYQEVDHLAKLIPFGLSLDEALASVKELKVRYDGEPRTAHLVDLALRLEGVARHASTHAAGVIISSEPLREVVPVQKEAQGERLITQYDMYSLDLNASAQAIGLLKMDFLGLANLTILEHSRDLVKQRHGVTVTIETLPLDDRATYELLARGETTGVFQLESDGMKRWLKELRPSVFEDIISMVALYRPGPMEAIPDFVKAKRGEQRISYLHPTLEPMLRKTYGVIVTQEQVLEIARAFAGFTYTEADVLRKAVGKKIRSLLIEQREKFISGAVRLGSDQHTAERVWEFIEPFARYGFNRAHATCYALIAYQTAYMKAHYPAEFMAALLTSEKDKLDKVGVALRECERLKLKVLPPDVNESDVDFSVVQGEAEPGPIRFGLSAIKHVGLMVARQVVEERRRAGRFTDLADFLRRLTTQIINRKALESLIKAGALDQFHERNQLLAGIDHLLKVGARKSPAAPAQAALFAAELIPEAEVALRLPEVEPADKRQQLRWERELLSMYVSEHPLSALGQLLQQNGHLPIGNVRLEPEGVKVKVAGVLSGLQTIVTKNGSPMAFARLEDLSGSIECLVFPRLLEVERAHWVVDSILSVTGRLSTKDRRGDEGHDVKLIVDRSEVIGAEPTSPPPPAPPVEEVPVYEPKTVNRQSSTVNRSPPVNQLTSRPADQVNLPTLTLVLPERAAKDLPERIRQLLSQFPGASAVRVVIKDNGLTKTIPAKARVSIAPILRHQLIALLGAENVRVE